MTELLEIENLRVCYGSQEETITALDSISLTVKENELLAVVGESGCGKSTLALATIGLLPTPPAHILTGAVDFRGVDLLKLQSEEMRQYRGTEIAMIFQEPLTSLNPVYRIGDQIAEAITIKKSRADHQTANESDQAHPQTSKFGGKLSSELRSEVVASLKLVRIPDAEQVIDRYPFELSGGMRQRVMIAMALSQEPALLIADEPSTALDVTTQAQVLRLMKELMDKVKTSILLITHDLAVACQVADRVAVMYAGDVVETADVYELFSKPLHPYTQGLLSCLPAGSKDQSVLKPIPGSVPDLRQRIVGCKYTNRCPHAMKHCAEEKPNLTNVSENHQAACFLYDQQN